MRLIDLRRRLVTAIADRFWLLAAKAGRLHPNARPARHRVEVLRDLRYAAGGAEHLLDVYRPSSGSGPWPALLYVHGGGFRVLSKDTHWVMGLAFARQGYVVFNINYRLAPAHPFPAALEDTIAACAWVARHAAQYGGDPSRLVLAGESAGANLVTALTVAMCYRRDEPWARRAWELPLAPRAVLPACGMFQVSDVGRLGRRRKLPGWLREHLDEVEQAYLRSSPLPAAEKALADPLLILERGLPPDRPLPPFFAAVGTRDPLLDDTRRLKAALDNLGVLCEVQYYPGEMHAFQAFAWRPRARDAWRQTHAFLARQLGQRAAQRETVAPPAGE